MSNSNETMCRKTEFEYLPHSLLAFGGDKEICRQVKSEISCLIKYINNIIQVNPKFCLNQRSNFLYHCVQSPALYRRKCYKMCWQENCRKVNKLPSWRREAKINDQLVIFMTVYWGNELAFIFINYYTCCGHVTSMVIGQWAPNGKCILFL